MCEWNCYFNFDPFNLLSVVPKIQEVKDHLHSKFSSSFDNVYLFFVIMSAVDHPESSEIDNVKKKNNLIGLCKPKA